MRLFSTTYGATFSEMLEQMQYKGCANDECYFHPYSSAYPLYFQFPHNINLANSLIGVYGLDGVSLSLYPFSSLSSNDYSIGNYKCGGVLREATNITGLLGLPDNKCFVLVFFITDSIGNNYQYATEPMQPIEMACRESYFNLTAGGLSSCGCDNYTYQNLENVTFGNPDLKHVNTLTIWGEYKRLADARKYELDAANNKKKSTNTFERWKVGSTKTVPSWLMEQANILFDAREVILTSPTLDAIYFDHSDDNPFEEIDVPCSCHYIFDTTLEKLSCTGGIFCANDGMIGGCTSPCFENFNPLATYDDGSCFTPICEPEVTVFIDATFAYWQGVTNNLLLPDGTYIFLVEFIFDSLCNCAQTQVYSTNVSLANVIPVTFSVVGGVITSFNSFSDPKFTFPNYVCTVNLRPVTPVNYFGKLYSLLPLTLIYDFETNINGLASPIISATKICL